MTKRRLEDVLQPDREHLQGLPIPSLPPPGSEPVSVAQTQMDDMDALIRLVKRKGQTASWLEPAIIKAFELGKSCGMHGGEDRFGFGQTKRDKQAELGRRRGQTITSESQELREKIRSLATYYRQLYPEHHKIENSTDQMARWIARKVSAEPKTILDHLRALKIS